MRIHYKVMDRCPPEHIVEQNAGRWLQPLLPDTFSVQLNAWEEIPGKERFHDRFALTERGGIQLGTGFAARDPQSNVLVTILDEEHAAALRARFAHGNNVYNQIGSVIQILSDGSTSKI